VPGFLSPFPCWLDFFRFGSVEGGLLLFLLLRDMRLSSRATSTSNTSNADLSAGDRSFSLPRSALTELMAESTSISSIFNCPHSNDLECEHYRTGFQNEVLAAVSESAASYKMIRLRDDGARKKLLASFLWLGRVTIMGLM